MKFTVRAAAIAFIAVAAVPLGCAGPSPELSLEDNRIRVSGPGSAEGTLVVRVAGSSVDVFGEVRVEKDGLSFEPRFPLKPGVEYRACFRSASGEERVESFQLPLPPASAPARVVAVYPSRDVLPENLLKFYLHFSAPMSRREAYQRVHLRDSAGKDVELPFLEIGEELWDRSATRLTLLFDPGRIKRGLKPREDSGPALEEGKSYTLVIDRDWLDAEGRPLQEGFRKAFKVSAPDEKQPDPKGWTLTSPKQGTTEPLTVIFDKSLDQAMLGRSLGVVDAENKRVAGRIEIDLEEKRWRFHPELAWRSGKHALVVNTDLEDMAGNSIDRPFEVDIVRPVDRAIRSRTVSLPFEPSR
jgi:hypothetical protein